MIAKPQNLQSRSSRFKAFTLTEVVVSMAVTGIVIAGTVSGYLQAAKRAEWSAYSLAAQSLAMQRLEQARVAKWDPLAYPPVTNQLVSGNFPPRAEILDIPISGTNFIFATNFTTITDISTNPPLKLIRVECVWPFINGSVFTNSISTYRAPDQ